MARLVHYKCKECGYTIFSSEDGDYSLMSGPGHFYICPKCKVVFRRNWNYRDIDLTTEDYSFEKDKYLANLLAKNIPEDIKEVFIKDVLWFQGEVIKGDESIYYGKTLTHDAVKWTKAIFWEKLFKYLQRKDYAKSIKINEFSETIKSPHFEKYARYNNSINNVKCSHCNGQAFMWSPLDGCPKCGNVLELESNCITLVD